MKQKKYPYPLVGKISQWLLYTSTLTEKQRHDYGPYTEFLDRVITRIDDPVGEKNELLSLFPIPAADFVNIESDLDGRGTVALRNCTGQLLFEGSYNRSCRIDLGALPQGVYMLCVSVNGHTTCKKLVVCR